LPVADRLHHLNLRLEMSNDGREEVLVVISKQDSHTMEP
jgi:hypothetical protein